MAEVVSVVIGAGVGGGLRYVVGGVIVQRWGSSFPWHTFAINVVGAFLLGVLMVVSAERALLPAPAALFLGVGILGGFTTFSTLSYETVALMQGGQYLDGMLYVFGSAVMGIAAAAVGVLAGRAI